VKSAATAAMCGIGCLRLKDHSSKHQSRCNTTQKLSVPAGTAANLIH
jgi:hypothetical protein